MPASGAATGEKLLEAPPTVSFTLEGDNLLPGEKRKVTVSVKGFKTVTTAQFSVQWDPAVLKYEAIGDFGLPNLAAGNFNTTLAPEGRLAVSWDDQMAMGLDMPDGTVVFAIEFTAIGQDGTSSSVEFGDAPTTREVTVNFEPVDFSGVSAIVRVGAVEPPILVLEPAVLSIDQRGVITITGTAGGTYVIETADEIRLPIQWTRLATLVLTDGTGIFEPDESFQKAARFYRAVGSSE